MNMNDVGRHPAHAIAARAIEARHHCEPARCGEHLPWKNIHLAGELVKKQGISAGFLVVGGKQN